MIFETNDLDANSVNIGKVFAGIGYRKPTYGRAANLVRKRLSRRLIMCLILKFSLGLFSILIDREKMDQSESRINPD